LKAVFTIQSKQEKMSKQQPKSSGASATEAKSGGAGQQILSTIQETLELVKKMDARLTTLEDRVKDLAQICQTIETKLDSTRVAGAAKGRGASGKSTNKKDDEKTVVAPPAIGMWFKELWKEDREGTIEKYCDAAKVEDSIAEVKKNPTNAKKEGNALEAAVASYYYTKYFAKPSNAAFDRDGRDKLKTDHDALKAKIEAENNTASAE
jgi:hypothetical protein